MDLKDRILLGHGSGGKLSHDLISKLFIRYFGNPVLSKLTDSAILDTGGSGIAFTTDTYVVDPVFFPGGNIGKLAVCGTINDLAVSGAEPLFLSAGFIIEEGFLLGQLKEIVASMADEAGKAGVRIVTGDTKVVNKGKCDKIFINTSGIGKIREEHKHIGEGLNISPGDQIIINGTIGDHGISVMAAREDLNIHSDVKSDCASLNGLISEILLKTNGVKFMRDATRGGLATVLSELAEKTNLGIQVEESSIPVKPKVRAYCELLGFDPLYIANEGKVVIIADPLSAEQIMKIMKNHEFGKEGCIIGEITTAFPGKAWVNTGIGGKRLLDMLAGEQLPRIC